MKLAKKKPEEILREPLCPNNAAAYWLMFFALMPGALLISTPLVLAASWPIRDDILFAYFIAAICWTPICLIFSGTQIGYLQRKSGCITLNENHIVSVFKDIEAKTSPMYSAPLTECRWFYANRSWATVPVADNLVKPFSFENSLLIEFPDSCRTPRRHVGKGSVIAEGPVIAPVGLTNETREDWLRIFEQLDVPQYPERETERSPLSESVGCYWVLLTLPASFYAAMEVSRNLERILLGWNVPADIATGLAFPFFIPGTIFLLILLINIPFFVWHQSGIRQLEAGRAAQWNAVLRIVFVFGVFSIFSFWSMQGKNGWTQRSAVFASIVSGIMGFTLCVYFWRNLADKKTAKKSQQELLDGGFPLRHDNFD